MAQQIGIIGVGLMGHGIARNLAAKGWPLHYLHHAGNQPTDDLDALGARKWQKAAEMAAVCDVLIICVTGSPQVEDVLLGSGNVLAALRPGTVVVDCSTAIPASTVVLARKVQEKGAIFVDAPMTRTPKEAEEGRLNLLVGGDSDAVDRLLPVLQSFSENIFRAGGIGTGHQLKLLHNIVSLGSVTLIAEVVACAKTGGVDMAALLDCLRKGGGGGVALERVAPYVVDGTLDQLRFTIANAAKDASYYNQMTRDLGAANLVSTGVQETMDRLVKRGHGAAFMPQQVDLLRV